MLGSPFRQRSTTSPEKNNPFTPDLSASWTTVSPRLPVRESPTTQNLVYPMLMLPIEIVRTEDNRRERRTFAWKLVLLRVRSWRVCLVSTYPARDVVTE